jgi:hypothetical protein
MTKSSLKANVILKNKENDKFAQEKICTALFFCNTYLPIANSFKSTIKNSFKSLKVFS